MGKDLKQVPETTRVQKSHMQHVQHLKNSSNMHADAVTGHSLAARPDSCGYLQLWLLPAEPQAAFCMSQHHVNVTVADSAPHLIPTGQQRQ